MSTLGYYYFKFSFAAIVAPPFVCIAAMMITWRMTRFRWLAHTAAIIVMLLSYPGYVRVGEIIEPSSIGNPGNGIGYILHAPFLFLALMGYAVYAWLTRTKLSAVGPASRGPVCPS